MSFPHGVIDKNCYLHCAIVVFSDLLVSGILAGSTLSAKLNRFSGAEINAILSLTCDLYLHSINSSKEEIWLKHHLKLAAADKVTFPFFHKI